MHGPDFWRRPDVRGPLLMLGASLAFTLMVACVKFAREEMSALDVAAWRGIGSVPLAILLARGAEWKVHSRGWLTLRVLVGFGAMTCFFTAAKGLGVADLSLLGRLQPILIALLAPLVLGRSERSNRQLWGLTFMGLLGCSIILSPSLSIGNIYGIWALAAIGLSTFAHITLRALGAHDDPRIVVMVFQIGVTILAFGATTLIEGHTPTLPPVHLWWPLLGVGVLATIGQLLMTRAYALASAARVAQASHTAPVWAICVDIVIFDLWPSFAMLIGGSIVMIAVLCLIKVPSTPKDPCRT